MAAAACARPEPDTVVLTNTGDLTPVAPYELVSKMRASFWVIALKTQRFWPYWITGWQLIAIFGHVQKLMFSEILARPYALLSMYISYPILFVILYASGSTRRREDTRARI